MTTMHNNLECKQKIDRNFDKSIFWPKTTKNQLLTLILCQNFFCLYFIDLEISLICKQTGPKYVNN